MGIFSKKEAPAVTEREFLDLKSRVANLEMDLAKLQGHIVSLRGRLNRNRNQELDSLEDLDPEQQKINKVLLPEK